MIILKVIGVIIVVAFAIMCMRETARNVFGWGRKDDW